MAPAEDVGPQRHSALEQRARSGLPKPGGASKGITAQPGSRLPSAPGLNSSSLPRHAGQYPASKITPPGSSYPARSTTPAPASSATASSISTTTTNSRWGAPATSPQRPLPSDTSPSSAESSASSFPSAPSLTPDTAASAFTAPATATPPFPHASSDTGPGLAVAADSSASTLAVAPDTPTAATSGTGASPSHSSTPYQEDAGKKEAVPSQQALSLADVQRVATVSLPSLGAREDLVQPIWVAMQHPGLAALPAQEKQALLALVATVLSSKEAATTATNDTPSACAPASTKPAAVTWRAAAARQLPAACAVLLALLALYCSAHVLLVLLESGLVPM